MYLPMSYGQVIEGLQNKLKAGDKTWKTTLVNTDHSGGAGIHYNICRYGLGDDLSPQLSLLEPYKSKFLSDHITKVAEATIKGVQTKHFPTGVQRDNWRCGYICTYWQLTEVQEKGLDMCNPPAPPLGWIDVVLRLMDVHDMTIFRTKTHPRDIGLRKVFDQALSTGVFVASEFLTHINNYIANLGKSVILLALHSSYRSVTCR
jgi:hypothetical protein